MLRFIAQRKFNKARVKMLEYGEVNPCNWPEFKALHIESMILACMVDFGSYNDPGWALLQAQETIKDRKEDYIRVGMPIEMYCDLVVTTREKVKQLPIHYRETADKLKEISQSLR